MNRNLVGRDLGNFELYGGVDPRHLPRYSFPDGARATGIPVSTLRAWVVGQSYNRTYDEGYFEPVIDRPSEQDSRLSFANIIEAHILRALRTLHKVSLRHVREAIDIAEKEFGIDHLLISPDLRTSAGQLFLDRYTHLMELSPAKQYAIKGVLKEYLSRIEFDESKLPYEFQPFERSHGHLVSPIISLSPFISFGRAIIRRAGVSTLAVYKRIESGEDPKAVMDDYGLEEYEIEEAILYESAA
ncbi:MAG: DUF433 domain-containing protein [Candidatus Aegiribacteria sp.]